MKKYLLILLGILLLPITVNANSSATVDITTKDTIKKDNTINVEVAITSQTPIGYYEYTLDYNSSKLKLVSGSSYNVDKPNNSTTKSIKKTFKFKVLSETSSKISIKSYAITSYSNEENLDVKVSPLIINNSNNSSNNYLSSLEIKGYKLSPTFDKETLNYNVEIPNNIDEINIIAKAEDKNATISGDGNISLVAGTNKIEIIVTSEDGNDRTYTITTGKNNKKQITVKIDNQNYTIVENIKDITIPTNFEKSTIIIDGQEIESLYNKSTKYTLVALKSEDGTINLFKYDNIKNAYTLYQEIVIDKFAFIPIKTNEKFKDYKKSTITIDNIEIDCYKSRSDSKYAFIYGINSITGEEGWYSYNEIENTIQKYNKDIDDNYNNKINNSEILIYILTGAILIFGIIVIILTIKLSKKRKKRY